MFRIASPEHGREHRQKIGPKGLAKKVYQRRKTEIAERRFFPERLRRRDVFVADWINQYLDRVKGVLRGYANLPNYARLWKLALSGKVLRQILPGDIERQTALAKLVAPATVNRELAFIKRVFAVAIDDGLVDNNPARAVKKFIENNARVRHLSHEEERRLLEAVSPERWPLFAVAIHTGLRQSEPLDLRWSDVDFASGIVTVPRAKHGLMRHVEMNDTVRAILRELPSRLKSPFVFPSTTGQTPLDGQNLQNRIFAPAIKKAGIEGLRWHDLRHTFASRLVMAGSTFAPCRSCSATRRCR